METLSSTRSSDVLADFHVLEDHRSRAENLRYGLITARYASVPTKTVVVAVELVGSGTTIAFRKRFSTTKAGRPKESIDTVVTDSEALAAFRCGLNEAIGAVPFSTIHGYVNEAILELGTQLGLASD